MAYRNYRELTDDEISELERLYPVTPNRELVRRYNISVDALQDHVAMPRGWKKNRKAVFIGNRRGKILSDREVAWIVRHYANTKNSDIMQKMCIGESTLHRVARKYGLKKTRQFTKKCQQNAANVGSDVCRAYGVYEQNAEYARQQWVERKASGEPMSRWRCFQKGESNKTRLSKKRFAACIQKAQATRNETIRKEKMRIAWGLPQKTKMKLVSGGKERIVHRHLFRKKNYIVERGDNVVYYNAETRRSEKMEANAHRWGLKIMPLE